MENEIARIVVDHCFRLHQAYGPGLLESVYEEVLCYELKKEGLFFERQKQIPLVHEEVFIKAAFRADLIVERKVLIELKSVETLPKAYYKIVLTYLKLTDLKLGLLINFNVGLIKDGIHRIVNNL
jgi:GxxExxY protein